MCLEDTLTDLRPDEGGMPEKVVPTDHRPADKSVLVAVRTDLRPVTIVDAWSPWDCYQGPLSPLLMIGYGIYVISSKQIHFLRRRRDSYVTSMVICGTEGEC